MKIIKLSLYLQALLKNPKFINSLELYTAVGYLNGTETINNACKQLYKNSALEITEDDIRSINLNDIEYATGIKREETKYTINYRSKNYTYKYNDILEFTTGNFYTYEENGETITSNTPKIASSESPVSVKTNYIFTPSNSFLQWNNIENKKIGVLTYGDLLGNDYSWIDEKVSFFSTPKRVDYGIALIRSSGFNGNALYRSSSGDLDSDSVYRTSKLRPLIYLNKELLVDSSYSEGDGKSESTPWKMTK